MEFNPFEIVDATSTAEPITWPDDLPFIETDSAD